ncbi:hypothetical protein BU16DRAFT_300053 [Lophium mytilinum]|uniref:Uncharacterized protein n=1 Tax=Lophium mytilinum TaxID=390894 RepID=A0A6A6R264_9PEZI|nr:hypothetical protein BU16DRAFT_300053 [Lophium mytilinum]
MVHAMVTDSLPGSGLGMALGECVGLLHQLRARKRRSAVGPDPTRMACSSTKMSNLPFMGSLAVPWTAMSWHEQYHHACGTKSNAQHGEERLGQPRHEESRSVQTPRITPRRRLCGLRNYDVAQLPTAKAKMLDADLMTCREAARFWSRLLPAPSSFGLGRLRTLLAVSSMTACPGPDGFGAPTAVLKGPETLHTSFTVCLPRLHALTAAIHAWVCSTRQIG